ncbi:MAG: hypothetical protein JST19_18750, partial [Bacteroidetes bacterium]|nr:hypothetical protein [Bacteroidota bacterium]
MKFFYTLLCIALPCTIFAQSNYRAGYVVKSNGDTLKGFVDYHEWDQNPTSVDFKVNKDDHDVLNFNPRTIKEFRITGAETYIAYKGQISMDRNAFPDLPRALDTTKKIDTIFLRQLIKGKYLALFYHRDFLKTRFFIAETGALPVELRYSQYYDNGTELAVKSFYKGQFLFYINRYRPHDKKLTRDAADIQFNQTDLENMVSEINGDSYQAKKAAYFRGFVGAGLNNIKSHFWDNDESIAVYKMVGPIREGDVYPETVSKYSTTVSPRINLGIDAFTNPEVQKLIFRMELSFSYNSPRFQYVVADPTVDNNVTKTYSFDQYSATLTPQVILNLYNKNNFKIYADAGFGLNFSLYS